MTTIVTYFTVEIPRVFGHQYTLSIIYVVVSGVDPVRNISWILFQEGRSSELRLRRGVGQAAHTLNKPQVEGTGVLLCVIRE